MKYENLTDVELVDLLKEDNSEGFEVIYRRYWRSLFGFVFQQLGSKEDAEENNTDDGDKNEVGESSGNSEQSEMSDAAEAKLTPVQKAAHDKAESEGESGKDKNDQESND